MLGTRCAALNELADSIFNVLALFFRFSETRHLGEYSKHNFFGFWKLSFWGHSAIRPFLKFCSIFKIFQKLRVIHNLTQFFTLITEKISKVGKNVEKIVKIQFE